MASFMQVFRNTTIQSVNFRLWILMLFNFFDGILTYVSLQFGYAVEKNPVANLFIADFFQMVFFKIFLPSLFMMLSIYYVSKRGVAKTNYLNHLINLAVIAYLVVMMNHAWVSIQLFTHTFFPFS